MATSNYLTAHAATATEVATRSAATLAGYHFVFWVAAGLFLAGALLTAALFRSGPLPAGEPNQPALAHLAGEKAGTAARRHPRPGSCGPRESKPRPGKASNAQIA